MMVVVEVLVVRLFAPLFPVVMRMVDGNLDLDDRLGPPGDTGETAFKLIIIYLHLWVQRAGMTTFLKPKLLKFRIYGCQCKYDCHLELNVP